MSMETFESLLWLDFRHPGSVAAGEQEPLGTSEQQGAVHGDARSNCSAKNYQRLHDQWELS